jgi:hypothetical protein
MEYKLDQHEVSIAQIRRINESKANDDDSMSSAGTPDDDHSVDNIFEPLHQIHFDLPPGLLDEQLDRPKDFDTQEDLSLMSNMTGASASTAGNRDQMAYPTIDVDDDDDDAEDEDDTKSMDIETDAGSPSGPPPLSVPASSKDHSPATSDGTHPQGNPTAATPKTNNYPPPIHQQDEHMAPNNESTTFSNNGPSDPTTSSATDRSMED